MQIRLCSPTRALVLVRVLQRNRNNKMWIHRQRDLLLGIGPGDYRSWEKIYRVDKEV